MNKEPKLDSAQGCLQKRMQCINQSSLQTSIPPLVFCTVPKFLSMYIYVMKSIPTQGKSLFLEDLREQTDRNSTKSGNQNK